MNSLVVPVPHFGICGQQTENAPLYAISSLFTVMISRPSQWDIVVPTSRRFYPGCCPFCILTDAAVFCYAEVCRAAIFSEYFCLLLRIKEEAPHAYMRHLFSSDLASPYQARTFAHMRSRPSCSHCPTNNSIFSKMYSWMGSNFGVIKR